MKLRTIIVCVVFACIGGGRSLAGSIDYLTNQSADYIRTFSRNAATDGADAATFNPAGTAFLEQDGLYLSFSSQTILKFFAIGYEGTDYEANNPTPFLPSFFAVYKWRQLAGYVGFSVPAGGGSLSFNEGVPYLVPLKLFVDPTVLLPTSSARRCYALQLIMSLINPAVRLLIYGWIKQTRQPGKNSCPFQSHCLFRHIRLCRVWPLPCIPSSL